MTNTHFAIIMLAAGIGIPLLATLNAALGRFAGSPAAACVALLFVAMAVSFLVTMITGSSALANMISAPKYLFLGGVLIAFYILSITWIAPHFGVGNAVFFVLLGQLISAAVIDHFGLFGAIQTPLTATRMAGIAVMTFGVFLTQVSGRA